MDEQIREQRGTDKKKWDRQEAIKEMLEFIRHSSVQAFSVMEVCGTHTRAISQYGIRQMVEPKIRLLSGPGCPVCVTSEDYIDTAVRLLQYPKMILATFGDMMKVNGTKSNLLKQKEYGKDIRIVYSPLDAITLADKYKDKQIVFLAVGFETTAPIIALAVRTVMENNINNLSFLIGLKRMEPILHHILSDSDHNIQGIICPGHVAAVKGADYFRFITEQYHIPAVVAGFGEMDIIGALYALTLQQASKVKEFRNLYQTCVISGGNREANRIMEEIFDFREGEWRGIGKIRDSELSLKENYRDYDAEFRFSIKRTDLREGTVRRDEIICRDKTADWDETVNWNKKVCLNESDDHADTMTVKEPIYRCSCSDILMGKKYPWECTLFGKACSPEHPVGPCMVSTEGACSVSYQYR